jgi:FkbM family methyltransferase
MAMISSPKRRWWTPGLSRLLCALAGQRYPRVFRFLDVVRHVFGKQDEPVVRALRSLVSPGICALDIGANVGYYSRLLSRLVGPKGRVFAFEPTPETVTYLRFNTRRKHNVRCIQAAVGDREGSVDFYIHPWSCASNSLYDLAGAAETVRVPLLSIDTFVKHNSIDRIGFVKIDVEGAEPRVLDGMKETLAAYPEMILLIEFAPNTLQAAGVSPESFMAMLRGTGLRIYSANTKGIVTPLREAIPDVTGKPEQMLNLFCSKTRLAGERQEITP